MMSCSSAESQAEVNTNASVGREVKAFGAFLDTTPWLCYQQSCPMVVGHTVVYIDTSHITTTYADELEPLFRAALERVIVGGGASTRKTHNVA
jgi:hypothetical protein